MNQAVGMQGVTLQSVLHQRNQQADHTEVNTGRSSTGMDHDRINDTEEILEIQRGTSEGPRDFELKGHEMVESVTYRESIERPAVNENTYIKVVKRRAKRDKFADAEKGKGKTSVDEKSK
jgi:hypothetical protein